MKRCPECGREYDNTMMFCLDDGAELLYGPATPGSDEPATAILHTTDAVGDAPTRAQIHTTEQTAILPSGITDVPKSKGFDKRLLLPPLALAVIVLGGFFGYKYFSPTKQIESIAVMPFVNESGNADVEYLSDGMTETLISSLSQLPNLNVKGRSSVFRYKGKDMDTKTLGKELGVQAVLYGRMIQRGDQLTLSLELLDAVTENVIWSGKYDRKQADVVSLQSEIARDVSAKLKFRLSGAEETKVTKAATSDTEAYQAYLKGRYYWNRRTSENLKKAVVQFKTATDRDPNYALAFAGLADCYALLNEYSGVPLTETAPQATSFAERAIMLDGSLAEPHATLGSINKGLWRWADAEREFKRAIELNPSYATAYHWYSIMLIYSGRKDEALAMIQRAHEIDPLSSIITSTLSWTEQSRGNYQRSLELSLQLTELDPDFALAYNTLGLTYLKLGRNAEAIATLEKAARMSNRYDHTLGDLGFVYASAGNKPKAVAMVKELEEKYARKEATGGCIATVYAGLGEKQKALEWLEKDLADRDGYLPDITVAIPFDSLRDDPRFKDLLKRMNLPE